MGDMADFAMDHVLDDMERAELGFDDWDYEGLPGSPYKGFERLPKTCRSCGQKDLYWKSTDKGWRLADEQGREHRCKKATCNRCQKKGLQWVETDKGWRLFGEYGIHVCGEED